MHSMRMNWRLCLFAWEWKTMCDGFEEDQQQKVADTRKPTGSQAPPFLTRTWCMTYTYHCIVRIIFNVHLMFFSCTWCMVRTPVPPTVGETGRCTRNKCKHFFLQKYKLIEEQNPILTVFKLQFMDYCHWQRLLAIPWMPPGSFLCKPFTAKPWHASNKNGNLSSPLHSQTHFSKHQQERNQWKTCWSNSEKEILTLATHNGNYCEVLLPVAASQGDGQHVAAIIQTGSQRYKKKIKTQERHDLYRQIQNKVSGVEFDWLREF